MLARTELDEEGRILHAAADLLEISKWYRGGDEDLHYCYEGICLFIAIWDAKIEGGTKCIVKDRAADRVMKYLGFSNRSQGTAWNDAPDRTKEQVVEALRNAAYFTE